MKLDLSSEGRYALRALVYLAREAGWGELVTADRISAGRNDAFYAMKEELEKKARELGGKVQAPNVQLFTNKRGFEAFHLKKPREA
jgi:hypothetical protein